MRRGINVQTIFKADKTKNTQSKEPRLVIGRIGFKNRYLKEYYLWLG